MFLITSPIQTPAPSTDLASADREFVTKATKDGQAEVGLATLAQKKATSDKARTLAAQLRTDHDRANAELTEIARRKGASVDPAPNEEQTQAMSKLTDMS